MNRYGSLWWVLAAQQGLDESHSWPEREDCWKTFVDIWRSPPQTNPPNYLWFGKWKGSVRSKGSWLGSSVQLFPHSIGTVRLTHLRHSCIQIPPFKKDVLFGWRRRLPQQQGSKRRLESRSALALQATFRFLRSPHSNKTFPSWTFTTRAWQRLPKDMK